MDRTYTKKISVCAGVQKQTRHYLSHLILLKVDEQHIGVRTVRQQYYHYGVTHVPRHQT